MTPYTIYEASGRILRTGYCPTDHVELQVQDGESALLVESNDAAQYVVDGAVVDRPDMGVTLPTTATADGTTETIIAAVPIGAHVHVFGPTSMDGTTEAAGDVVLTFALPGDYTVSILCFPFVDVAGVIHAA